MSERYRATLNRADLTMEIRRDGKIFYWLPLDGCQTAAGMLDLIMQIACKPWATKMLIGEVVRLLRDGFEPQRTLCSFGQARPPINVRDTIKECDEDRAAYKQLKGENP